MGSFLIRQATPADAAIIATHRVGMFRDMGRLTPEATALLLATSTAWLGAALETGEYVGWLAVSPDGRVLAGAGVQRRQTLPFAHTKPDGTVRIASGRVAVVVNVYTEPPERRRGLARALMERVLAWAREVELDDLVLHAAPDGLHLYESLGFAATNEMRYRGPLGNPSPLGSL